MWRREAEDAPSSHVSFCLAVKWKETWRRRRSLCVCGDSNLCCLSPLSQPEQFLLPKRNNSRCEESSRVTVFTKETWEAQKHETRTKVGLDLRIFVFTWTSLTLSQIQLKVTDLCYLINHPVGLFPPYSAILILELFHPIIQHQLPNLFLSLFCLSESSSQSH